MFPSSQNFTSGWQPIFAFEVSLAQAQIIRKSTNESEGCYYMFCNYIEDLCYFHEHLVHDKAAGRERIRNKAHVFAELIDACAKDGVAMAEEYVGESLSMATVASALPNPAS
jgi:hypothetical protein